MLANFLIGLREGLEAALVVGILLAYLTKTGRRDLIGQVWLGVAIAVGASLAFGALLTFGPAEMSEAAGEVFAGTMSILAVALLTWMIFWMARTARHLRSDLHGRLDAALTGGRWAVLVTTLLAVGREGLETALFLWAAAGATGAGTRPLLGAVLGLATAVTLGWAIFRGAVALNLRSFFSWTGLLLVVIAGGVLSYGIHELQEAGILPGGESLAFDITAALPPESWYGTLLKGLVNLDPTTTWLQAVAWTAYVVPTSWFHIRTVRGGPGAPRTTTAPQADREPATVA